MSDVKTAWTSAFFEACEAGDRQDILFRAAVVEQLKRIADALEADREELKQQAWLLDPRGR